MLTHLHVKDYTLVESLKLDLQQGLTVLTGETGAGKSILLDALHLAVGDRADTDKIRAGAPRAEVSASFDIAKQPLVSEWLAKADLDVDGECIVRRVVTQEGRSRAYINGRLVTLGQLRNLGDQLLDIHSQHEHQSLLQVPNHRKIIDAFGAHTSLAGEVKRTFQQWQAVQVELDRIRNDSEELNARYQLLHYQVEELDLLGLAPGELETLEANQKQLENAVTTQQTCQQVMDICCEGEGSVRERLNKAIQLLQHMPYKSTHVVDAASMLDNALIQVEETGRELERELNGGEPDEFNLPEIEARLSAIYDIARKHRVSPEDLIELHERLSEELSSLRSGDDQLEQLEQAVAAALQAYRAKADKLSGVRAKAAKALSKAVNQQLSGLAMGHARFEVALHTASEPAAYGNEAVELLISTIPGQPAKPLAKIASGGELSRISLAIQVVIAKTSVTPTLIFDEVDVGIGGSTGDVVGLMLRELGETAQILCVTHLAQVASKAHHHLRVEKSVSKKAVQTRIDQLSEDEKVLEIARMMGGVVDSEQSLAHAKEMLVASS